MKKYELPPRELIQRFLTDTCTDTERAEILQWYAAWEDEEDPLLSLADGERSALQQRMLSQIETRTAHNTIVAPARRHFRWLYYTAGTAAASILLFLGIHQYNRSHQPAPIVEVHQILQNSSAAIHPYKLDDGSIVWLKPGATLIAPVGFAENNRSLRLTGEAFFDVAANPKLPFRVSTAHLTTEVLGTSFSMKEEAGKAEVTVFSGKVAVKKIETAAVATTVLPHQKVSIPAANQPLALSTINANTPEIWERCELDFNNATIGQISQALNKRFQVHITIKDSTIAHYTLKADFSGMHLPAILELMHKALNINYSIKGEEIILHQPIQ
ncbi:FecR family protein [Chitinophaga sp. Cy-1792]|uniref:FecR family protein n=1 Tax=Chitinophaga sp. Cy-1792 TaxID=2608339 RepID=UPI001421E7FD|nr:FecR domain-containing protein [Chitinophaga sp. Cy-1792]NIG57350.1 DUF4974 domain-containing protein [Chitinophaga sp. Cy-1792]